MPASKALALAPSVRRGLAWLVVAAGLFGAAPAGAFSLGTHRALTEKALAALEACRPRLGDGLDRRVAQLRAAQAVMIRCNRQQDCPVRKAALWHFLPATPGQRLQPSAQNTPVCPLEPSLRPWFEALVAESVKAAEAGASAEGYALLGAMLHYLQDAAVPSHVVPIFHPTGWICSDRFDEHLPEDDFQPVPDCQALAERSRHPLARLLPQLLDDTAARARGVIDRQRPPGSPGFPGELFWHPQIEPDGFGRYGCVGNRFGTPDLRCGERALSFEKRDYDDLAKALQTAAVMASATAMLALLRRLPPPGGAGQLCPLPLPCEGGGLCGARPDEWQPRACWNPFARSSWPPLSVGDPGDRCQETWRLSFDRAAYVVTILVALLLTALLLAARAATRRLLRR